MSLVDDARDDPTEVRCWVDPLGWSENTGVEKFEDFVRVHFKSKKFAKAATQHKLEYIYNHELLVAQDLCQLVDAGTYLVTYLDLSKPLRRA